MMTSIQSSDSSSQRAATPIHTSSSFSSSSSSAFTSPAMFMSVAGLTKSSSSASASASSSSSSSNSSTSSLSSPPPPLLHLHDLSLPSFLSSSASPSLSSIVRSGPLLKRQPLFTWSERYFILTVSEFFWYKRDRHTPLPFSHPAPVSHALSSPSSPPLSAVASSPAASPTAGASGVWGEERGHWFVADMAIRYESEKRTFQLVNTNMSGSAHVHHHTLSWKEEKEKDIQHEIHLKATNDFEYRAWQNAFQRVIRIQETKKSIKGVPKPKEKVRGLSAGHEEDIRRSAAHIAPILPLHQRRSSASFQVPASPPPASKAKAALTPPPTSSALSLASSSLPHDNAPLIQQHSVPVDVLDKSLRENESKKTTSKSAEVPCREEDITIALPEEFRAPVSPAVISPVVSSSSYSLTPPSIYLVSLLLPASLSSSLLAVFDSSIFPLLSSSSSPSLQFAESSLSSLTELVIYRPFSSSSSASSLPFSFVIPSSLCSSSLRFSLSDGSLIHFSLSCLLNDFLIFNKAEGQISASDVTSTVEVEMNWILKTEENIDMKKKDNKRQKGKAVVPSVIICVFLALFLISSLSQVVSSSSLPSCLFLLLSSSLCSAFLFFTALQNFLWRDRANSGGKLYVITVTRVKAKERSGVDSTPSGGMIAATSSAGSTESRKKLRKRVVSQPKRKDRRIKAVSAEGFLPVQQVKMDDMNTLDEENEVSALLEVDNDSNHEVDGAMGDTEGEVDREDINHQADLPSPNPLYHSSSLTLSLYQQGADLPLHSNIWGSFGEGNCASVLRVRGKHFLEDRLKIPATFPLFRLEHCEFIKHPSKKLEHFTANPKSYGRLLIEQRKASEFADARTTERALLSPLFVVNFMFPVGSEQYSMVLYFTRRFDIAANLNSLEGDQLPAGLSVDRVAAFDRALKLFLNSSNDERDRRFKMIPRVIEGPWIAKKAVGTTPVLLGRKIPQIYYRSEEENYIEIDVDVASSVVAGKIAGLLKNAATNLVFDLAFVIQGNVIDELPESLLGTFRLSHLDLNKVETTEENFSNHPKKFQSIFVKSNHEKVNEPQKLIAKSGDVIPLRQKAERPRGQSH